MKTKFLILSLLMANMVSAQDKAMPGSIRSVAVRPDFDQALVEVEVDFDSAEKGVSVVAEVSFEGETVTSAQSDEGCSVLVKMPESFRSWTPDHPWLYDLKISVLWNGEVSDEAEMQFAMRRFGHWREESSLNRFALNGLPIFLFGTLWASPTGDSLPNEAIASDLQRIKDLGYNMVRVRDEIDLSVWLPLCDRVGLVLWHDGFAEVANRLQNVPTVEIQLPVDSLAVEETTDNYVEYANRLYQETYRGFSAAVIGRFAETMAHLDSKRLFFINRKISHALAE